MPAGSSIVSVSSLAASGYREHLRAVAPLLNTATMQEGIDWCRSHSEELAGGRYQFSEEAVILYTMRSATALGARGIRINCTGPGVTETPILRSAQDGLRAGVSRRHPQAVGRVSGPAEQASVLMFLNSRAASYISGQVVWVDGGNIAAAIAGELEEG